MLLPALALLASSALAQPPTAHTTAGDVSGAIVDGVRVFRSIPFAAPPLGALRFAPPAPPAPWSGVKDASAYATPCAQLKLDGSLLYGGEDCLQLSVYARERPAAPGPRPVLVWIYGGAYVLGDDEELGFYDAVALAKQHDMIIVAPNYRLGPFGFMALDALFEADGTTGNAALLDQALALQWVRDNAAAFGGDPARVTIAGESAGAFSVAWHLTSPRSAGLFAGALLESGTFDSPQFFQPKADAVAFNTLYAAAVGCNSTGGAQLACLRALPMERLLLSLADWLNPNWPCVDPANCGAGGRASIAGIAPPHGLPPLAPIMPWGPAIDGTALPSLPLDALRAGTFAKVPVLLGTNKNEGSIFVPVLPIMDPGIHFPPLPTDVPKFVEHAYNMFPAAVVNNLTATLVTPMYPPSAYVNDTWNMASDALTHAFFACSTRRAARAIAAGSGKPVFMYQFSHKLTFPENELIPELGNYHVSERACAKPCRRPVAPTMS